MKKPPDFLTIESIPIHQPRIEVIRNFFVLMDWAVINNQWYLYDRAILAIKKELKIKQ